MAGNAALLGRLLSPLHGRPARAAHLLWLGVVRMGSGGARARSGPQPDLSSGRSDRRGLSVEVLPAAGFVGDVPEFPLPNATGRELELWDALWRTPQAAGWAVQSWRWQEVGQFVRLSVRLEDPAAPAGLYAQYRGIRTELGLSPAGLRENGWQIATVEPPAVEPSGKSTASGGSRARLGVIRGGAG